MHTASTEGNEQSPETKLPADLTHFGMENTSDRFVYVMLPLRGGHQVLKVLHSTLLAVGEPVGDLFPALALHGDQGALDHASAPDSSGEGGVSVALVRGGSSESVPQRASSSRAGVVKFGDIVIDTSARLVTKRGATVQLSPRQFDLLLALCRHRGAVVSRVELLREVWGGDLAIDVRTVDNHIYHLRRKLEDTPDRPSHLTTVNKLGYRLAF